MISIDILPTILYFIKYRASGISYLKLVTWSSIIEFVKSVNLIDQDRLVPICNLYLVLHFEL